MSQMLASYFSEVEQLTRKYHLMAQQSANGATDPNAFDLGRIAFTSNGAGGFNATEGAAAPSVPPFAAPAALPVPVPHSPVVDDDKAKKRKRKSGKDPRAPKRPKTTYFLFMDDARQKLVPLLKQQLPDVGVKTYTSACAKLWRDEVTEEEREKYTLVYNSLKQKHKQDMDDFNSGKEHAAAIAAPSAAMPQAPPPPVGAMSILESAAPLRHEDSDTDSSDEAKKKRKAKKEKKKQALVKAK